MRLSDVSYRLKIPLALTAVILLTELVLATALMTRAYRDAGIDLEAGARNLTTVLTRSLRDPLVRDDLWQAFEVVSTPLSARTDNNPLQSIVVLDAQRRVFVSTDPLRIPATTGPEALPAGWIALAERVQAEGLFRLVDGRNEPDELLAAAGPIVSEDGTLVGTVLLEFDAQRYQQRLRSMLVEVALVSLPGLLLLIPLGLYWGKRMAEPLSSLSTALSRVGREPPSEIAASLPPQSEDEIGRLARQAHAMLDQLARNDALEREVIASERLAAVGRVSAAIAHEINNPLGGMLNAIDTVRRHGQSDAFTRKTLGLLERGLEQIRVTVSALLVEARLDSPQLAPQDWQDLRMLVQPQVDARGLELRWHIGAAVDMQLPLPAHQIRQLVLNLLLNAIKAVDAGGFVELTVERSNDSLCIDVTNDGAPIAADLLERLFEPMSVSTERDGRRSHGLGLWVCYQIVQQLQGRIGADSTDGITRFSVQLPIAIGAVRLHEMEV